MSGPAPRNDLDLRLAEALRGEFAQLRVSGSTAGVAFRAALASVLSMIAAMALHLDNPYWAAITAVSIVLPDVSNSFLRSIDRCLGTLVGAAVGYFGARFVGEPLMFQLICASAVAFGIYGAERSAHGYAVLLGAVTVVLVMFGALQAPYDGFRLAIYRSMEIMVGVGVSYCVQVALAPGSRPAPESAKPGIFAGPVDEDLLAIAVTGGLAVACIPLIWQALDLPGLGQTPITAFVILIAMRRGPAWVAVNRVAGCVLGGGYGLLCMRLVGDSFALWIPLLFGGLYVACYVKERGGEAAYTGHQAAVAVIMSMVQGLAPSQDILPAIERLVGMIGGIVVVVLAQAAAAPLIARAISVLLGSGGARGGVPRGGDFA
ncbi:MAG TPA: FUSC family protein [Roseiarcus sp.]